MPTTDKELALLAAEEKKLLEQQGHEGDALKKRLAAVKKQIRKEQRRLNERRAELLGRCMMQKFSSDPEAKETMLQDLDGFLSKPEDRELFGLLQNRLLQEKAPEISPGAFVFLDRRPYAAAGWGCSHQYPRLRCGTGEVNFFGLCMRLPGRDGTENSRALNGVVCLWRSSKAGCTVPGCSRR